MLLMALLPAVALVLVEVAVGSKLVPNPKPMVEDQILSGAHGSFASLKMDLMCFTHDLILDAIRP